MRGRREAHVKANGFVGGSRRRGCKRDERGDRCGASQLRRAVSVRHSRSPERTYGVVIRTSGLLALGPAVMLAGAASFPQPDGWPAISTAEHSTEILGPGVTYDRWQLQTALGPLAVHVTSIDLRNPLVTLNVATQRGVLVGPGEALSSMADRA